MTPLDLNKMIAEMKGCIVIVAPNGTIHEGGDCNVRKYRDAKIPNWAENIADAWELFEEMPNPKLQLFNHDDAGLARYPYRLVIDFNSQDAIAGATAPLAICIAWIKWKQSEGK